MQIAIFGGSFNPPHLGHFLSAQQLVDFGFVDQVWLMPCYAHVWNKKLASPRHRLAMAKFLENKDIKVSTLEIEQKRAVSTIETLKILIAKHPNYRFLWIIGGKSVSDLPKWQDYEELIKNYYFLIVPEIMDVSSSIVRERTKKGLSIKSLVPEKVREYIEEQGLYT